MRTTLFTTIALATLLTLASCSEEGSDTSQHSGSAATETIPDLNIAVPEGRGVIHITTGPRSPEIVTKGFYHLRDAFAVNPFPLRQNQYALMDSIEAHPVVGYAEFSGLEKTVDSLEPGTYNLLVYVSRLSKAQVKPDTVIGAQGDTTIVDPTNGMSPYDFYLRPIMVDSIIVSAGSVALVDLSASLESWSRPQQLANGGWEAPRARYMKWDGRAIR